MHTTANQPSTSDAAPAQPALAQNGPLTDEHWQSVVEEAFDRMNAPREGAFIGHLATEISQPATEQAFAELAARCAPAADPQRLAAFEAELAARAAARTRAA